MEKSILLEKAEYAAELFGSFDVHAKRIEKAFNVVLSCRDSQLKITGEELSLIHILDVLSGGTTSYTQNLDANALQGMRIGVLDQLYQAYGSRSESEIDEEIIAAFENAVAEMEACGAEIVHMTISGLFSLSEATLDSNSSSLKENLYAAFESAVEENDVDAVVFPTYISAPLKSGTDENGVYWNPNDQTYITNCKILGPSAGVPEISVPIGTHSRGAGIGMEICALKNEEQLLLNIAYSYTTQYCLLYTSRCV